MAWLRARIPSITFFAGPLIIVVLLVACSSGGDAETVLLEASQPSGSEPDRLDDLLEETTQVLRRLT